MPAWFGDGFDLYALPADAILGHWDSGSVAANITAAGRFAGSRAWSHNAQSGVTAVLQKSSGSNDATHHLTVAITQSAALSGTNNLNWFTFSDGATAQCSVVFRSDGAILLTSGASSGATLATYAGALTATNTWHTFEIEVVINNTTGSVTIRKNGNTSNDFTLGSLNTRGGTANNYSNRLTIGNATLATPQTIDDLLWRSDAASVPWIGDVRCYTRLPATDAAVAWTRPATFQMQPYAGATSNSNFAANSARYTPFVSQGGTIGSVVVNMLLGYTGNMKCTIFASSGGQPGAVLQSATAPITNPVSGANTFSFSPAVSIAKGTQLFVGVVSDAALPASSLALASTPPYSLAAFSSSTTYAAFPVASPSVTSGVGAFPFFPVVTPAANADAVADSFEDGAASYVSSANPGDSDLYTLGAISGTPTAIVGVTTRALMQKSDAGSRTVAVQVKSGATTVESAAVAPSSSAWGWVERVDTVDPATGSAWTATGVNSAQIGVVVKT